MAPTISINTSKMVQKKYKEFRSASHFKSLDLNLVIIVPADGLAPNGARPST